MNINNTIMEVQTRCNGVLVNYLTIAEAYAAWQSNPEIEKISWSSANGVRHIWRPFKKGRLNPEIELQLNAISQNYRDTALETDWWFDEPNLGPITEVTPDASFRIRYCTA